jgi:transitional endoplasmic reticulum ATPase
LFFIGPSGCGKTLMAKSFADELGLTLIQVRPSDILSMFVGESIMRLRRVFDDAIFFDEVECFAPDPKGPRGVHSER